MDTAIDSSKFLKYKMVGNVIACENLKPIFICALEKYWTNNLYNNVVVHKFVL